MIYEGQIPTIETAYAIISIIVSVGLFFCVKLFIKTKLNELQGAQKLLGISSIAIAIGESIYLGTVYGLFQLAIEFIAYLGIGLWLILIPFQNSMKNIIAGVGNFMNTQINVGDIVEIKGKRGVIIELHLSKTVLMTEEGERINVPNHKFSEEITVHISKKSHFKSENLFKYI